MNTVFNTIVCRMPSPRSKAVVNRGYQAASERSNPDRSVIIHRKNNIWQVPLHSQSGAASPQGPHAAEAQALSWSWTKRSCTYRSMNPGSPFHPQEVKKSFDSSARDLEPLLRNKGHGDQLSLVGGGSVGKTRTHW